MNEYGSLPGNGRSSSKNAASDGVEVTRSRAVYVISVAAELAGLHPQTLRIYERKGLIDPARTDGGNRRYSEEDIHLMQRIQTLTQEGLNLQGVKRVIELEKKIAQLNKEINELHGKLKLEVEETHRLYRRDLVPLRQWLVPRSR